MNITPPPAVLPKDFYVYEHRKATTGEVFYVGKGQGIRAWAHHTRSRHWTHIALKHGVDIAIIADGLVEWYAHELECELIALHGRSDTGHGHLINLTDGGDGASGYRATPETKSKISAAMRGENHPRFGKKTPQHVRDKIAAAHTGKSLSDEHKQTLRDRHAFSGGRRPAQADAVRGEKNGRCRPVVCIETGEIFPFVKAASDWLASQGRSGSIYNCCYGLSKTAGGYRWEFVERKGPPKRALMR